MAQIENVFEDIVRICTLLIELAGVIVILTSMVRGMIDFIQKRDDTSIRLARGIMLGLEFKIGSEVLRSVIVTDWNELGKLAAIILLRSVLTLLLLWEISVEEKRQREKAREDSANALAPSAEQAKEE